MIKYLFNFAYYKFGIEITLIVMIILIGSRMDIISCIYAIWLAILFNLSREAKRRIWPLFQWFIVSAILMQYLLVVDVPPFLCSCKLINFIDYFRMLTAFYTFSVPTKKRNNSVSQRINFATNTSIQAYVGFFTAHVCEPSTTRF